MDWDSIVTYGLIAGIVSLMLAFLNKGASEEPQPNAAGAVALRMHRLYQILGVAFCLVGLVILVAGALTDEAKAFIYAIPLFLFFALTGAFCLKYYQQHQVEIDDHRFTVRSWTGKIQTLRWPEVERISFHPFMGYIKVIGGGKTVRLNQHLVGLKVFATLMERHTKWTAAGLRLPIDMRKDRA